MTGIALAAMAALGTHLLVTRRDPATATTGPKRPRAMDTLRRRMLAAGLEDITPAQFLGVSLGVGFLVGVVVATAMGFGPVTLLLAALAACAPAAMWRRRASTAHEVARDHWPRMIEELRVRVGPAGRPLPQALIEVGLAGPDAMRPAFSAAQREWALTADFPRTLAVLKQRLDDAAADATCETLLVAHEVGGDIDARLAALAEDRRRDLRDRKEATARQAGARLARWFVVVVPVGMAVAGANLGDGAEAFRSGGGQAAAMTAVGLLAVCWWWAGRIMALPHERRVFDR